MSLPISMVSKSFSWVLLCCCCTQCYLNVKSKCINNVKGKKTELFLMCIYLFLISHDIRLHLCHLFKMNFVYPFLFPKRFQVCFSLSLSITPAPLRYTHKHPLGHQGPCLFSLSPHFFVAVQSLSHVWPFATPWTAAYQASLSFTISLSLLKFMSIESVILSNLLIFCLPLLLWPSVFPSIRVFSKQLALHIR